MLVLDQLKRGDRPLQWLAGTVLAGLLILLAGLWYVQVMSAQRYRTDVQEQSFRTVRVPALRGRILDRNGIALADNRPSYNVNLYLEELRSLFRHEYTNRVKPAFLAAHPGGSAITRAVMDQLQKQARYQVVSNILWDLSSALNNPKLLLEAAFHRHYEEQRSLPLPLLKDLEPHQVARFLEKSGELPGVDLDIQPARVYPHATTAAHLLGHLRLETRPLEDEEFAFRFYLPDYVGVSGLEHHFDAVLRGRPGVKSVLVNSMAYRQSERTLVEPEAGKDVVLTIDTTIQKASERALGGAYSSTRGAIVVMEVQTGDLLAVASSPTFDPNQFLAPISPDDWALLSDPTLRPLYNRALFGTFPAGSVFKIVVALAALEAGNLNPTDVFRSTGEYVVGPRSRPIRDTAGPGDFDFERAFCKSSNPYFIHHGLAIGPGRLIEMGRRFRLGEPTGMAGGREARGYFPENGPGLKKRDGLRWMDGDTANLSIGHGEILVTPVQMAVMTAAVANGGRLLQPRLVSSVHPRSGQEHGSSEHFPAGVVRGRIGVPAQHLALVQKAMLADVEHPEGTGKKAFVNDRFRVCGKTGTASLPREKITWFVAYAPYENPRYAVAVVVTDGGSGGGTCAPIAHEVFRALHKQEQERPSAHAGND